MTLQRSPRRRGHAGCVTDAMACDDIGVGLDHRAVQCLLRLSATTQQKRRRKANLRGWTPKHDGEYKQLLDENLSSLGCLTADLDQRCHEIESVLMDVATKCQEKPINAGRDEDAQSNLHELINQRRSARRAGCKADVRDISKSI